MSGCYLDASAIVKLATDEPESQALRTWLHARRIRVTSRVSTVEVVRALRRKGEASAGPGGTAIADALSSMVVLELDATIAERAGMLPSAALRSLDAVHLASALSVGGELTTLVTYDLRLADAARAAGLEVAAPGH